MSMPLSMFEKIWRSHVIAEFGDGADLLHVDRVVFQEVSGTLALGRIDKAGRALAMPQQVFGTIDHVIDTYPGRGDDGTVPSGGDIVRAVRASTQKNGITLFDLNDERQGIIHVVSAEQGIVLPGTTLVCGDSHTCTVGGVGALAWGIGASELEHAMVTQTLSQIKPPSMRVSFEGELRPGVYAKDMILYLIGLLRGQAVGYAVEFGGSTVRDLPVEARLTICNMAIELGAKYGFVAPDKKTVAFLKGRPYAPTGERWEAAVEHWMSLPSDSGACFDREITVDASKIEPQVTWGIHPQHVVGIEAAVPDAQDDGDQSVRDLMARAYEYMQLQPGQPLSGLPIDVAFIGSCTNARLSDLRIAASILKGRKVAPNLRAICVPGSGLVKKAAEAEGLDKVFVAAGFEWRESGCSLCVYGGGETFGGERVITTTNRNFEGRQGPGARSHLASPATVAASAIAGRIADVRELAN